LSILHDRRIRWERGIIKCVPRIRVLSHLNVPGRLFEALEIGSTRTDFNIVVRYSVEDAYWMVGDLGIADVSRIALWIERNISRWIDPTRIPHLMESFEGRVERRLSAARESHDSNSVRIYPRMRGQYRE